MRTVSLLVLGLVLCGAASSSIAPGRALAQTRPADKPAQHMDHNMEKMLVAFADAWNRHDVDALMSFMAPDGVFEASGGNTVNGERHEGQQAVRAAYAAVFATYPDARWNNARHFVAGDRGVSEWTFTGTMKDGKRVEVTGCDLFTFKNGKIALKNSYRKNRPPIG
jgi:ketosteroid isomerase-like protein